MVDYLNSFFVNYGDTYNSWDKHKAAKSTMTTASAQYPKGNFLLIYPIDYYYAYQNSNIQKLVHKIPARVHEM